MPTRRHVSLAGITRGDVDDVVEEVSLPMLTTEVLIQTSKPKSNPGKFGQELVEEKESLTYPAYDVLVVGEMCLAVLAPIDLVAI